MCVFMRRKCQISVLRHVWTCKVLCGSFLGTIYQFSFIQESWIVTMCCSHHLLQNASCSIPKCCAQCSTPTSTLWVISIPESSTHDWRKPQPQAVIGQLFWVSTCDWRIHQQWLVSCFGCQHAIRGFISSDWSTTSATSNDWSTVWGVSVWLEDSSAVIGQLFWVSVHDWRKPQSRAMIGRLFWVSACDWRIHRQWLVNCFGCQPVVETQP